MGHLPLSMPETIDGLSPTHKRKKIFFGLDSASLLLYCSGMTNAMIIQGRQIAEEDLNLIRGLLTSNPDWNRTRLSRELCARWDWRNAKGQPKDMAARTLLLKLERAGHIRLPPRQGPSSPNGRRNRCPPPVVQTGEAIRGELR